MNQKLKLDLSILQFMLRAQLIARRTDCGEKGYAMMMTSVITIFMFSLLAAYMTITNLTKLTTNAHIDGNNTFYVAESGLNRRANQLRQKFVDYNLPSGLSPGQATTASFVNSNNIANCFPLGATATINPSNDFDCQNYAFRSNNNAATVVSNNGDVVMSDRDNNRNSVNYIAYTFVSDRTNYASTSIPPAPIPLRIPADETYGGLFAQQYRYTVYATAAQINAVNAANPANSGTAQTVLQMEFKSRIVPLFQFAAFYENDLEMDSITAMTVTGPVHTNSNFRVAAKSFQTGGTFGHNSSNFDSADVMGGTRLLGQVTAAGSIYDRIPDAPWRPDGCAGLYPNNNETTQYQNCGVIAVYTGSSPDPRTDSDPTHYAYFPDFSATNRTTPLTTSELAVFGGRIQDGVHNQVRRLNPPKPGFLRERNYLTGEVGRYYGKADLRLKLFPNRSMPFNFTSIQSGAGCNETSLEIPSSRQGSGTLTCRQFSKGQLRSLQQPVLSTQTPPTGMDLNVLTALRVAIAASPTLVTFGDLNQPIPTTDWGATFSNLLDTIASLDATAKAALLAQTPTAIVAARGSSFLPPPIQLVTGNSLAASNNVNGGFYNQLKGTWMTMLQTNIRSLTYWNRDGIYVEPIDPSLTTPYTAATTLSLASGLSANNLAFIKAAADSSTPVGSFTREGLAAIDRTEGGLVFHATVSDDTNGDGTNEITAMAANPIPGKDAEGNVIPHVDNYRIYPSIAGIKNSPYGFAFSGGEELPSPLTIATDSAIYLQGDYNNPGVAPGTISNASRYYPSIVATNDQGFRRQPAAIMADTITVLSNQCLNTNKQVNCGIITPIGSLTGSTSPPEITVTNPVAINAAFASNLRKSAGGVYNGGLNKFMRFLEDWSGAGSGAKYVNYTGSFVSLGEPLESNEVPTGMGVPARNFNYETNFNAFDRLPPLTPSAIYLQQEVFKRSYN
jgi:hypothetical protein